ncbi:Lrp/AsnC family transcriptional regulator [Rhodococcus jostii]|uniref:Lrp/AsnC family transcriptional regulator n=1 Tax=Rhodococcus jostii TaxID=132919 RepID=UPI00363A71D9
MVELECRPGQTLDIAHALAQDPEAQTIDLTAGGRNILVTIGCRNHQELGDYVLERMSPLASLDGMRTHLLTGIHKDASSWQLRALDPGEVVAVQQLAEPKRTTRRGSAQPESEAAIFAELARDGRATAAELSSRLSLNVDKTRAAMNSILESGRVVVRTEIARPHSGRPAYAWYFLRTSARSVDQVLDKLSPLNDVRLLARSVGPYNIIMAMWLRTIGDIQKLEMVIEQKVPEVRIEDRSLVFRTPKHLGRLLTSTGINTGQMTDTPLWA